MNEKRLLIVEDEKPIADILAYGFRKEGFTVQCAHTGAEGLKLAQDQRPDLVLLDWMLPDLSGVDVCRLLTEKYNIPIVMLTARSSVDDKLLGLETGADDYITKPFDLREVIGRVKAILRRFDKSAPKAEQQEGVRSGKMLISEKEWSVMMDGMHVSLTPKEFELREQLLARIWGYDFYGENRTVDIHVQRLRKKLGIGSELVTVFGVGYKYEPGEEQ